VNPILNRENAASRGSAQFSVGFTHMMTRFVIILEIYIHRTFSMTETLSRNLPSVLAIENLNIRKSSESDEVYRTIALKY